MKQKTIEKSKVKALLIALGFPSLIGCLFPIFIEGMTLGIAMIMLISLMILSWLLLSAFGGWKIFDNQPGIVFTADGFTDNSSVYSSGFVPWRDVTDVRRCIIKRQESVLIYVKDVEKYMKFGGPIERMMKRVSIKFFGTPIEISANGLKISQEELTFVFVEQFAAAQATLESKEDTHENNTESEFETAM